MGRGDTGSRIPRPEVSVGGQASPERWALSPRPATCQDRGSQTARTLPRRPMTHRRPRGEAERGCPAPRHRTPRSPLLPTPARASPARRDLHVRPSARVSVRRCGRASARCQVAHGGFLPRGVASCTTPRLQGTKMDSGKGADRMGTGPRAHTPPARPGPRPPWVGGNRRVPPGAGSTPHDHAAPGPPPR